jgi:hypothetical protein
MSTSVSDNGPLTERMTFLQKCCRSNSRIVFLTAAKLRYAAEFFGSLFVTKRAMIREQTEPRLRRGTSDWARRRAGGSCDEDSGVRARGNGKPFPDGARKNKRRIQVSQRCQVLSMMLISW